MADENQGALASKGAVRNWTEEEKDVVWEQALWPTRRLTSHRGLSAQLQLLPIVPMPPLVCFITMSCGKSGRTRYPPPKGAFGVYSGSKAAEVSRSTRVHAGAHWPD